MRLVDVSVVIVNWNSKDYLRPCLRSLRSCTNTPVEVVVIDAGSFDGVGAMLASEFPDVKFIQCDENVGFARANNLAFETTTAPFVLFLNPDTELLSPVVDILAAHLRQLPEAGLLGARLLNSDGSVQQTSVMCFPTLVNQFLDSRLLQRWLPTSSMWGAINLHGPPIEAARVEAVSGACMMVRRETFEAAGRFNESYFMYAEDLDLAHEVARLGLGVYHVGAAVLTHHGGSSSGQAGSAFSAVMLKEANYRFLSKTRGMTYARAYRASMLLAGALRWPPLAAAAMLASGSTRRHYQAAMGRWAQVVRWALGGKQLTGAYYA